MTTSRSRQLDAFRDSAAEHAKAYRVAADRALVDFNFPSEAERKARAEYYLREAEKLEAVGDAGRSNA